MNLRAFGRFERFLRFALVGGTATVIQYAVLIALVELAELPAVRASTVGYVTAAVFGYFANYRWTFSSDRAHAGTAVRFAAMTGFGLTLNAGIMWVLHHALGLHYVLAQVVATGTGLFVNFAVASRWVYARAS
ncbi:MAG: GtrA family protein [Steroidobacteraceae bacterium]|nr:GtrA family protein [Steroidobacteraceae bacterium]